MIDSAATEHRTNGLRSAIAAVSDRPVTTVINSHWHTDHTNGNYQFPGATIVAHERTREMMQRFAPTRPDPTGPFPDVEWGALELALPFLTYDRGVTVWADDLRCEVRWVGTPAHTTDDTIVWIPEHSVLYTGDLAFNGGTPLSSAGSITGAIEVFQDLLDLKPRTVVPGHGDVCGPEVFETQIAYFDVRAGPGGQRAPCRSHTRWRRPGTPAPTRSPTCWTPNGWSRTCTAPTPRSTAPQGAPTSISLPPGTT